MLILIIYEAMAKAVTQEINMSIELMALVAKRANLDGYCAHVSSSRDGHEYMTIHDENSVIVISIDNHNHNVNTENTGAYDQLDFDCKCEAIISDGVEVFSNLIKERKNDTKNNIAD